MSYRSDPPLPSSDIITLLALGQTGEESQLRGARRCADAGSGRHHAALRGRLLAARWAHPAPCSESAISAWTRPTSAATTVGQNPAARVTVQQQFARNLIITYSTDVTSTQQQVIQIEYTVRPDVSVVALRDENGTFGVDMVFKKRFK